MKQKNNLIALFFITLVFFMSNGFAAPINFLAAGSDSASIQVTVDNFRNALGNLNGNQPTEFVGGRREINWDAVPDAVSDPNVFPGNFFNGNVAGRARGIEFDPTGSTTGFQVSSLTNPAFGAPGQFQVFSPEKLFRTIGGDEFDIRFFSPSDQITSTLTTGFGMVFTDADLGVLPTLEFFDAQGNLLHSLIGQATGSFGLGFMGTVFDAAVVSRIHVTIGDANGLVMDDFIFGEPTRQQNQIPEPNSLALMFAGALYFSRKLTRQVFNI